MGIQLLVFFTELNNSGQIRVGRTWGKRLHFQNSSEANKVVIEEREKSFVNFDKKAKTDELVSDTWPFKLILLQ